jgi:hypothetical protein
MKTWTSFIVGMTLALALPLATEAQTASDPLLGTWKMNPAKSKFDPGPAPTSQSRVYEATPDGIKITIQTTTASGETQTRSGITKTDGKPYPILGSSNWDAVASTTVNPLRSKSTLMRGGKTIGLLTQVESKDNKVLTATYTFTTPSGTKEHDVIVYDRQ